MLRNRSSTFFLRSNDLTGTKTALPASLFVVDRVQVSANAYAGVCSADGSFSRMNALGSWIESIGGQILIREADLGGGKDLEVRCRFDFGAGSYMLDSGGSELSR